MQFATALAAILLILLVGCQSPAPVAQPEPPSVEPPAAPPTVAVEPPPPPPPTPGERALAEGIALYDAGDFNGAIKRLLGAKEIWTDSTSTANKVAAHKYLAFSYCVTKRRTLCRKQFVDALKLDSAFNLDPTEKTHPIWGPEFERAKREASAATPPAKSKAQTKATPSSPPKAQ